MWAFVPLNPNELTAPNRGASPAHAHRSVGTRTWHGVPGDVRIGPSEVQVLRDLGVPKGQRELDQPSDSRGSLEVPDVGLEGTDEQWPVNGATVPVDACQRLNFDGISQRRTRAMSLDVRDVAWLQTGVREGLPDNCLLGRTVGGSQTTARAILIDGSTTDERQNPISIRQSIGQSLEDKDAAPFATAESVSCRVETSCRRRLAQAVAISKRGCRRLAST